MARLPVGRDPSRTPTVGWLRGGYVNWLAELWPATMSKYGPCRGQRGGRRREGGGEGAGP